MAQVTRIHQGKTPKRNHFILEWAQRRGLKQADIVREMPYEQRIDKSTVSRWFKGKIPTETHLAALAAMLELDEVASLFRHPDDDWIARLLRGRSDEDRQRIIQIIELSLPKTGTHG